MGTYIVDSEDDQPETQGHIRQNLINIQPPFFVLGGVACREWDHTLNPWVVIQRERGALPGSSLLR